MPGMSGQDTLKEMRARGYNQPVIVVTATGLEMVTIGEMDVDVDGETYRIGENIVFASKEGSGNRGAPGQAAAR